MAQPFRVNFHCHSDLSDGSLSPERAAQALASAGVSCGALTDHDTTEGVQRFDNVVKQRGIASLPGVEITVPGTGGQLHLLAFGFDPQNPDLQALLKANRQRREGSLEDAPLPPYGDAESVLRAVHRAGGTAFLAHPLDYASDIAALDGHLAHLGKLGLDGIEAVYHKYTPEQRAKLIELAEQHQFLMCAGTDFHGFDHPGLNALSIEFPQRHWERFRNAHPQWYLPSYPSSSVQTDRGMLRRRLVTTARRFPWKRYVLRTIFPTLLTVGLFVLTIFAVMLPFFERTLLERKRDTIRELTNSAWGVLAESERDVGAGRLTRAEAQQRSIERIESLRYGSQRKDYFWITDMHPRMVMHPYRKELNGADLSEFSDIRGRKLFVESVRLARTSHEGFVQYYWQWQDNPDRVVPKESFIRHFEPWDWIIGTGMYLDDVKAEVDGLTRRLVQFCLAITVLVTMLMTYIAWENLRIERRRARAEDDLRESHEKYASLVEAATEGTLMVLEERPAYANRTMTQMLGYSEQELTRLSIDELLLDKNGSNPARAQIRAMIEGGPEPDPLEACLRTKDGTGVDAILVLTRIALAGKVGFILVARDITHQKSARAHHDSLIEELQTSLLVLNRPLKDAVPEFHSCEMQTPIVRAAAMMSRHGLSALAVTSGADGAVIGIVTDQDLRRRVLAEGIDPARPVREVMTSPVITLPDTAPVHEALLTMRHHRIHHLALRSPEGRVVGIVRAVDLVQFQHHSPAALISQARHARIQEDILEARRRIPHLVQVLLESGAKPLAVARINTRLSDAITERLVEMALADLGPAPAPFCFLALGSQGREEQTLLTDQDHALVYRDVTPANAATAAAWFLAFGRKVATGLEQAGYLRCQGEVMASNPRWCQPLSSWQRYFTDWITGSSPQDLLECNTFFDFRPVAGTHELAGELRQAIFPLMHEHPGFFLHFAQNALLYKPPIGFFGQLVTDSAGPTGQTLSLKEAMMPIVNFARLYALRHGSPHTNTLDRLDHLQRSQVLKPQLHEELVQTYSFLMQLRLAHQARALSSGGTPDNTLNPRTLTALHESMLKHSFSFISTLQKKISYDYLGM